MNPYEPIIDPSIQSEGQNPEPFVMPFYGVPERVVSRDPATLAALRDDNFYAFKPAGLRLEILKP